MNDERERAVGHTPGPWDIQRYRNHVGFSVWGRDRGCIAERWYDSEQQLPYGDEICANARLIAAAPELLAVAQQAQQTAKELHDWLTSGESFDPGTLAEFAADLEMAARAALAKAKGGAS